MWDPGSPSFPLHGASLGAKVEDTHFLRQAVFADRYRGGRYLGGGAHISYRATEVVQVFLTSEFRRLWGFDGTILTLEMNSGESKAAAAGYSSGLDSMLTDWGIGIRFAP